MCGGPSSLPGHNAAPPLRAPTWSLQFAVTKFWAIDDLHSFSWVELVSSMIYVETSAPHYPEPPVRAPLVRERFRQRTSHGA